MSEVDRFWNGDISLSPDTEMVLASDYDKLVLDAVKQLDELANTCYERRMKIADLEAENERIMKINRNHVDSHNRLVIQSARDAEHIAAMAQENERLGDVLRSIACSLGAGGYNTSAVDPDVFEEKIRRGIDTLTAPLITECYALRAELATLKANKDA
jgi:hypothetical protein